MSFLYYICHQMWWQSVYALFFNKLSFFGDKCTPFCHHFVLRISNWNYRFLCFCAPNVTKRVDNCTQHKWSEQNQLVTNVLRYFRVIEKYWGFLSLPKMQSWRTHFVCLSDRVYSWNNFVHFTTTGLAPIPSISSMWVVSKVEKIQFGIKMHKIWFLIPVFGLVRWVS